MDHPFTPSALDSKICSKCHKRAKQHNAFAECESCGHTEFVYDEHKQLIIDKNDLETLDNILMCKSCRTREIEALRIRESQDVEITHTQRTEVDYHTMPQAHKEFRDKINEDIAKLNDKHAKLLDQSIQKITDVWNAKTTSIIELKTIIDADESIAKADKDVELFKVLEARFKKVTSVIKDARELLLNLGNEQQSTHSYMSNLANRLRPEIRKQFQFADINYIPAPPPKKVTIKKDKIDKAELEFEAKRVAKELSTGGQKMSEAQARALLEMICKNKNLTPNRAANTLCRATKETESEMNEA